MPNDVFCTFCGEPIYFANTVKVSHEALWCVCHECITHDCVILKKKNGGIVTVRPEQEVPSVKQLAQEDAAFKEMIVP